MLQSTMNEDCINNIWNNEIKVFEITIHISLQMSQKKDWYYFIWFNHDDFNQYELSQDQFYKKIIQLSLIQSTLIQSTVIKD